MHFIFVNVDNVLHISTEVHIAGKIIFFTCMVIYRSPSIVLGKHWMQLLLTRFLFASILLCNCVTLWMRWMLMLSEYTLQLVDSSYYCCSLYNMYQIKQIDVLLDFGVGNQRKIYLNLAHESDCANENSTPPPPLPPNKKEEIQRSHIHWKYSMPSITLFDYFY